MPSNQTLRKTRQGSITVCVSDAGGAQSYAVGARISVYAAPEIEDSRTFHSKHSKHWQPSEKHAVLPRIGEPPWTTDENGCVTVPDLDPAVYVVTFDHYPETEPQCVLVESGCIKYVYFKLGLNAFLKLDFMTPDCKPIPCTRPRERDMINGKIELSADYDLRNRLRMKLLTPGLRLIPGWASHRSGAQGCPGRITGPASGSGADSFARGGVGVHTPPPARRMLGRLRLRQGSAQARPSTANTADRPVHRGQPQELQAHPQSTADRPYGPGGSRVLQPGTGSPPGRTGPPRTGPSAGRVAARLVRTTGFSSPGGKPRRSRAHRPGYRRCRQEPQGGGVNGQHADGGLPLPAVQGGCACISRYSMIPASPYRSCSKT